MTKHSSEDLYEKYFNLKDRTIQVRFKSGRCIQGFFTGFFYGGDRSIDRWHFVESSTFTDTGTDEIGNMEGEIIYHSDIAEILFEEDKSVMKF